MPREIEVPVPQKVGVHRYSWKVTRKVRDLRKAAGISQASIAKAIKVHRVSVVNIEAGRTSYQLYHIPGLCRILNCEYEEFLG